MKESVYWQLSESSWREHIPTWGKKNISKSSYIIFNFNSGQVFWWNTIAHCWKTFFLSKLREGGGRRLGWSSQKPISQWQGRENTAPNDPVSGWRALQGIYFPLKAFTCCLAHVAIKMCPTMRVANELWNRNVVTKVEMCPVISHTHSSPAWGSTEEETISSRIFLFNQDCFI